MRSHLIALNLFLIMLMPLCGAVLARQDLEYVKTLEEKMPSQPKKEEETLLQPVVEYKAGNLRDPFQESDERKLELSPEGKAEPAKVSMPPSLEIQGIAWGGSFPQAIINNQVVKIGDVLSGAEIINISKEGVTVLYSGKRHEYLSPAKISLEGSAKKPGGQYEKVF